MRSSAVVALLMTAVLGAACSQPSGSGSLTVSPSAQGSVQGSPPPSVIPPTQSPSGLPAARLPLPDGFPVLDGAVPMPLPDDDPGLIGLWRSDRVGPDAYDFYAAALPEAGYPVIGLYPGEGVAQIRFEVPDGSIWQVVMLSDDGGSGMIEVRIDRP